MSFELSSHDQVFWQMFQFIFSLFLYVKENQKS